METTTFVSNFVIKQMCRLHHNYEVGAMPSDKTIVEKMHLKPGMTMLIIDPPNGYLGKIGRLPENVKMVEALVRDTDVVQIFVKRLREFDAQVVRLRPLLKSSSIIWVTYPKGTSGVDTDLNRDIIWRRLRISVRNRLQPFPLDEV